MARPLRELDITQPIDSKPYYTVADLVALTGAHKQTIRARLQSGEIPAKKLGKEWRIYPEAVKKLCSMNK